MTVGKTMKLKALLGLPIALMACALMTSCSDDDSALGSYTIPAAGVVATDPDVKIPADAAVPAAGNLAGTQMTVPAAALVGLPANTSLTVAGSGQVGATLTDTTFDVAAGQAVEVTLRPEGTVLNAPGATLNLPYNPAAIVAEGYAVSLDALFAGTEAEQKARIMDALFITKRTGNQTAVTTVISGTANAAGEQITDVTVTAPYLATISGLTSFSVFQGNVDVRPVITTDAALPAVAGRSFYEAIPAITIAATGGAGASAREITGGTATLGRTWSIVETSHAGVTINASGDSATLGGEIIPNNQNESDNGGTVTVTVRCTDRAGRTVDRAFTFPIENAKVPSITTPSGALPTGTVGEAYTLTLGVNGTEGTTAANYTWLATAGLPSNGLDLSVEGVISGTPEAAVTTGDFTVTASNSIGASAPRTYSIVSYDPVVITTDTLPGAQPNVQYLNGNISVTGGNGDYNYSIVEGAAALPAGLTLNAGTGAITGTPTTNVNATFTIRVADTDTSALVARVATKVFTINFNALADVTATVTGTTGIVDIGFSIADTDGDASSRYTVTFEFAVGGGAFSAVKAASIDSNGNTLTDMAIGTGYIVKWDTSFSLTGQRLGVNAAESIVVRVSAADNVEANTGVGTAAAVMINNSVETELPASGTHAIIIGSKTAAAGTVVELDIMLNRNGSVAPDLASGFQFSFVVDPTYFEFDTALNDPNDPGSGFAAITPFNVAAGGVLPNNKDVAVSFGAQGANVLAFVVSGGTSTIPSGTVIKVRLNVKTGVGPANAAVVISGVTVTRPNPAGAIPSAGISGTVIVE